MESENISYAVTEIRERRTSDMRADLGLPDAGMRLITLRLAMAINAIVARRRLTQAGAATALRIGLPTVSALAATKRGGFSVERLMTFLTALDRDIVIVIHGKPRTRPAGRISVVAA